MGSFTELFSQLDTDGRVRGRQFEHICKWFLTNDPVYKHELRRVWLWDEWPGRWGIDAGIDLVAEDSNGQLWAIQAKAYDPKYRVTKKDVNKFLAESGRPVFSYRMLIATTNLIDGIGERTIQDQEKRVTFFRLNDLAVADVNWPRSPKDLRQARPRKPARPRKHQRDAIRKVVNGFEAADRGQLIMACGTGKTLTALFVAEELEAKRTLVLVPSLSLLKQTLNVWRANCITEFASLPVCSDDTVAKSDDDVALSHTSDLGVPVTTDAEEIAAFLRQRSGSRVVLATYQSSPQIAEAFTLGRVPGFDLVIADEAHRCAGRVSSDFATILDPAAIRAKRRLFMTATPRYFTGRVLKAAEDADFEIASMDDEAKFGNVFHKLSFGEAIQRGLLTDYQVVVVGVDDATYREWADNGILVTRDGVEVANARTLAGQIGLAKAMKKYNLHRVISFHSRVERARDFANSMSDVISWMPARQRPKGTLWSHHASGEMPAGDRYVLLQHLAYLDDAERGLLTNARCLAEGVDVPTLDGIAFIDPRRSEVDIVQAVGRAIRKSEDKSVGTIVIPVFIDNDTNTETALNNSAFKPVWDVIKALRAHDEELGEQLDELRREMGRRGGRPRLPDKIYIDVPERVDSAFVRAFEVRLVEQTTLQLIFKGLSVGTWASNQRSLAKRGELPPDRARRLETLSGWRWERDLKAEKWEDGFRHLEEYIGQNGDSRVPDGYQRDGYNLGTWVQKQRSIYQRGSLSPVYARRLEALPGWLWESVRDERWECGFQHLEQFVKEHGHARIPAKCILKGYGLGTWVNSQRTRYVAGTLEPERVQRLEGVPEWVWDARSDLWEEGFQYLLDYVTEYGNAQVPSSYTNDCYRLGQWVSVQRSNNNKGNLASERRRRLEELPGWSWDVKTAAWEDSFRKLLEFVDEYGTSRVPQSYSKDGFRLGSWVNTQRQAYVKATLDPALIRRLESLDQWSWNPRDDAWEEGFRRLTDYIQNHPECPLPQQSYIEPDAYKLGSWVVVQRTAYDKATLSEERQRRLESLPGWSWDPLADAWEERYSQLLEYVKEYGTSRVPQTHTVSGFRLGAWVQKQRSSYAKGVLSQPRQRRLEELPGWRWSRYDL
ncbi:helicase [Mycolicibacterium litorale]|nr:helicase [Mycolicibacterium litorale]